MFRNRFVAGDLLAKKLKKEAIDKDSIILAIPRGGLQIGYSLAKHLHLELDVILTKKKLGFQEILNMRLDP